MSFQQGFLAVLSVDQLDCHVIASCSNQGARNGKASDIACESGRHSFRVAVPRIGLDKVTLASSNIPSMMFSKTVRLIHPWIITRYQLNDVIELYTHILDSLTATERPSSPTKKFSQSSSSKPIYIMKGDVIIQLQQMLAPLGALYMPINHAPLLLV